MAEIFPIGDLHICMEDEATAFVEYLNQRPEDLLILLGDIIHFAHSFWSPNLKNMDKGGVKEYVKTALKEDYNLWRSFFQRLRKPTIFYYGTHEMYIFEVCAGEGWSPPDLPSKINKCVRALPNCHEFELPNGTYVTGLRISPNICNPSNPKFKLKKDEVEKGLEETLRDFNPKNPKETIFCTHEPTDYYYTNMGYWALTNLLKRTNFKIHYHAHIHRYPREDIVGITPTVNRSILALYQHKREELEPLPKPLARMLEEKMKM